MILIPNKFQVIIIKNVQYEKHGQVWILCFLFLVKVMSVGAQSVLEHVNMFIGSTGKHSTEYGGTIPAVSEPFGMTQWCAATRVNGISRTCYHYDDNRLIGFMATHQPAVWMGDYGFLP